MRLLKSASVMAGAMSLALLAATPALATAPEPEKGKDLAVTLISKCVDKGTQWTLTNDDVHLVGFGWADNAKHEDEGVINGESSVVLATTASRVDLVAVHGVEEEDQSKPLLEKWLTGKSDCKPVNTPPTSTPPAKRPTPPKPPIAKPKPAKPGQAPVAPPVTKAPGFTG